MMTPQIWTASDAAAINDFLNSKQGVRWIGTLMTMKPKVDISKGTEAAALSGAYIAGYEHLLNEVIPATRTVRAEETVSIKPIDMTKD
jgi:hypothetical protein